MTEMVSAGRAGAAPILRIFATSVVALALLFLVNNYLIFWLGWPGLPTLFSHLGWFGLEPPRTPFESTAITRGWLQLALYLGLVTSVVWRVLATPGRSLIEASEGLSKLAAYIVRVGFWAVLLIGLVDMVISLLRVEGVLNQLVGETMATELGRTSFRGTYVHYPLLAVALVIAWFTRALSVVWLALLIVAAEFQIVIARFVFSYEQAFMGDLVRFWYAALFLFASSYTLLAEGHVRVDILYTRFSKRGKAWSNLVGSILFGMPLCWVILTRGMWGKANIINAPLLSFEVSQSGYGMYVKYLMAGFLVIYALSMLVQFMSSFLSNAAILLHQADAEPAPDSATL
jgi:TRAP-type mannitol/chloroaromatic compound transport system permease small subunit